MDTRLKKSTTFHPQKNEQTKVVNKTLVQFLSGYNQQHPRTWDQNLIYIQHTYNIAIHTSPSKFPFETFFGYLPPSPLDVVYEQGAREDTTSEALKVERFVDKIKHIHLQV